jgi:phosphoglycerol transferase
MSSLFAKFFLMVMLFIFVGCAERKSAVFAKIDFTSDKLSDVVVSATGLSAQEAWGRWADANEARSVKIEFSKPLPKKFIISIKGQALPEHDSAIIRVGDSAEKFVMPNKMNEAVEVFVNTNQSSQLIEIIPDNPVSPEELGINNDARKLSIGFSEILISE